MRDTLNPRRRLALAGLTLACTLAVAVPAAAQTGGTATPGSTTTTTTTSTTPTTPAPIGPPGRATLRKDGIAVAPADAPAEIQAAIAAGNSIRHLPYRWGGGHRSFYDSGYDCSGAVSHVLHAAGILASPLTSGGLASSWGAPGKGRWITVFANAGHTYMKVAGLRFDTSSAGDRMRQGTGPRWRKSKRKPTGYAIKYYPGF